MHHLHNVTPHGWNLRSRSGPPRPPPSGRWEVTVRYVSVKEGRFQSRLVMTHNGSVAGTCPRGSAEQVEKERRSVTQPSTLLSLFFFWSSSVNLHLCSGAFFAFTSEGSKVTHEGALGLCASPGNSVSSHSPKTCRRATRAGCSCLPAGGSWGRLQLLLWTSDRSWFKLGDSV